MMHISLFLGYQFSKRRLFDFLSCYEGYYMTYEPDLAPSDFDVCPVLLTQPEKDRWTPQFLSDPFWDKIKKVPVKKTILKNGSHYLIANGLNY